MAQHVDEAGRFIPLSERAQNNGGPAFPMPAGPEPRVDSFTHFNEGMSLRQAYKMAVASEVYKQLLRIRTIGTDGFAGTVSEVTGKFADELIAEAMGGQGDQGAQGSDVEAES